MLLTHILFRDSIRLRSLTRRPSLFLIQRLPLLLRYDSRLQPLLIKRDIIALSDSTFLERGRRGRLGVCLILLPAGNIVEVLFGEGLLLAALCVEFALFFAGSGGLEHVLDGGSLACFDTGLSGAVAPGDYGTGRECENTVFGGSSAWARRTGQVTTSETPDARRQVIPRSPDGGMIV